VVSLPAGVFNPYSCVKTSILFLDKTLAKQTDKILFVKTENDGFDLGAQRREIAGSNFPQALTNVNNFVQSVRNGKEFFIPESPNILFVSKQQLGENGDYNLSLERYRENTFLSKTAYEVVQLSTVAEVISGQSPEGQYYNQNKNGMPFYQGKTEFGEIYIKEPQNWTTQITRIAEQDDILMSVRAPVGPVNLATQKICIGRGLAAIRPTDKIDKLFLFYYLHATEDKIKGGGGSVFDSISKNQIEAISLPLPPLNTQQEIVSEIESYQKIIDGARQVVENYKPHIKIDPEWPLVELGSLCRFARGPFGSNLKREIFVGDGYCVYEQSHAISGDFSKVRYFIDNVKYNEMKSLEIKSGDLIMSCSGTMGKIALVPENIKPGIINQALLKLTPNDDINPSYLKLIIEGDGFQSSINSNAGGSAIKNVASVSILKQIKIPLPSLNKQQEIVGQIEKEQQLVDANKQLIQIYEQKIKDKIAEVWET